MTSLARDIINKKNIEVDVETAFALLRHEQELAESEDEWDRIFSEDEDF